MTLDDYRKQIDEIDSELAALMAKRMEVSAGIAEYKKKNAIPVLDRARERDKLAKIVSAADGKYASYLRSLYSLIFELSRTEQNRVISAASPVRELIADAIKNTDGVFPDTAVVACQGVEGAFSQQACEKLFSVPKIMFTESFDGAFSAIKNGLCRYAVLPIENNTAGSVNKVYDLMMKHDFYIVKSTRLKVEHELLAKPGTRLEDIKEVYSHEQALSQCSEFIKKNALKAVPCSNTAMAAKLVAESDRADIAAISSRNCAELYGLDILHSAVQDNGGNFTRFICVSKQPEIYPGANKTSIMLVTSNKPGALYNVMSHINACGINITKLESRPIPERDFEFMFYFDLEAPVTTEIFSRLMAELEASCEGFRYLGSYTETV